MFIVLGFDILFYNSFDCILKVFRDIEGFQGSEVNDFEESEEGGFEEVDERVQLGGIGLGDVE